MPLYEFMIVARPSVAKATSALLQHCAQVAGREGSVVRNANVLGDRILTKPVRAFNKQYYAIGRYIQLLVDCNPALVPKLQREMRKSAELMRVNTHRMRDFYSEAQTSAELNESLEAEKQIRFEVDEKSRVDNLVDMLRKRQGRAKL